MKSVRKKNLQTVGLTALACSTLYLFSAGHMFAEEVASPEISDFSATAELMKSGSGDFLLYKLTLTNDSELPARIRGELKVPYLPEDTETGSGSADQKRNLSCIFYAELRVQESKTIRLPCRLSDSGQVKLFQHTVSILDVLAARPD